MREVVGHRVHVVEHTVACSKCHDMRGEEVGAANASACATGCHQEQMHIRHAANLAKRALGPAATADCLSCHAFGTGPVEAGDPWSCTRCHGPEAGEAPAVRIHKQQPCDTCHQPHDDPQVVGSECQDCHRDVHTSHATGGGKTAAQVCTTCHQQQHAPASDARGSCQPCHAEHEPIVGTAALFDGHRACTGCHRPHAEDKAQTLPCRQCHEDVPVLGDGRIGQHANCASCHDPHDVRGGITRACVGCHTGRSTDHPSVAAGEVCSTCHNPHPPRGQAGPARQCTHCHHEAASDGELHGSTCTTCHAPHHFKLAAEAGDNSLCARCHGAEVTATRAIAGHGTCDGCHNGLPHRPATAVADCSGCHARVASTAIAEHRDCQGCHEPHGGHVQKPCTSCHESEAAHAPAGHQVCASCHDAHTGVRAKGCTTCHGAVLSAPHGRIEGGCESCHTAHASTGVTRAPGCTTCHAPAKLAGLHQIAKHQACNDCHATHTKLTADPREGCLDCHKDMRDHQPDAPRCASCHLFR